MFCPEWCREDTLSKYTTMLINTVVLRNDKKDTVAIYRFRPAFVDATQCTTSTIFF